ncbi:MAG: imelysin family protein [Pseudomonadales bacterium]
MRIGSVIIVVVVIARVIVAISLLLSMSCNEKPPLASKVTTPNTDDSNSPTFISEQKLTPTIIPAFVRSGSDALTVFHRQSLQLQQLIDNFLKDGTQANWQALKPAWQQTHNSWHSTQFFLSVAQRQPLALPEINRILGDIHSAPITPGYLDSIEGYPAGGLVFDGTVPITAEAIRHQHRLFDNTEIAIGLHALEFLLWQRQWEHYQPTITTTHTKIVIPLNKHHQPKQRRRNMLALLSQLIIEDSLRLTQLWSNSSEKLGSLSTQQQQNLPINGAINQLLRLNNHSDNSGNSFPWQLHTVAQLQLQIDQLLNSQLSDIKMNKALKTLSTLLDDTWTTLQQLTNITTTDNTALQQQLRTNRGLLIKQLQTIKSNIRQVTRPETS